jgi:hypothetical protein
MALPVRTEEGGSPEILREGAGADRKKP